MANVTAIEADAGPVAPVTPPPARFERLFVAALQAPPPRRGEETAPLLDLA